MSEDLDARTSRPLPARTSTRPLPALHSLPLQISQQFAVQYEHRAAPQDLDRLDVINAIVDNISTVRRLGVRCCRGGGGGPPHLAVERRCRRDCTILLLPHSARDTQRSGRDVPPAHPFLSPLPAVQPPHKVNLSAPDKTILVNVLKSTCGLSVVDDFKQLLRYNVRLLAEPPEAQEDAGNAAVDGQAAAADKAEEGEGAEPTSQKQDDESDEPAHAKDAPVHAKDGPATE